MFDQSTFIVSQDKINIFISNRYQYTRNTLHTGSFSRDSGVCVWHPSERLLVQKQDQKLNGTSDSIR